MAPRSSTKRYYRKRVKGSRCRGKASKACRKSIRCRMTKGSAKRVRFCRKRTNKHRRKRM